MHFKQQKNMHNMSQRCCFTLLITFSFRITLLSLVFTFLL